MFKDIVKSKFKKISSREDFYRVKKELYKYGVDNFKKEINPVFTKENAFSKMISKTSTEKYSYLDNENFILTEDKYSKNHYLLIPNDLKYTNVLLLEYEDLNLLFAMKDTVEKYFNVNLSNKYNKKICYLHCYPYNSIHTLHLHVVPSFNYIHKSNNLLLDDVIYVLKNLQYSQLNFSDSVLDSWFKKQEISLLNIYIASCILIEQYTEIDHTKFDYTKMDSKKNVESLENLENLEKVVKKDLIPFALDYVLNYLIEKEIIDFTDKENSLRQLQEEKEILNAFEKILFSVCKEPHLLQKNIFPLEITKNLI